MAPPAFADSYSIDSVADDSFQDADSLSIVRQSEGGENCLIGPSVVQRKGGAIV